MEELAKKAALFFKDKPVKKAYIFGSAARGDKTETSDLDILVDLDYENGADFFTFLDMQDQLTALLGTVVDLVSSNGLSSYINLRLIRKRN
jgi:predicted nucleotidyltransferase